MTEKTREYQLQMEWTTGGILRKFQEISERQFSSTIATRFLSSKSSDSLSDLISCEQKFAVARFENRILDSRRIATIKSRRYLKILRLAHLFGIARRFETVSRVWSVRLSVSSVSPPPVSNEKRYVSHRQLTWVNYKRTSGLCSARMNLLAR